MSVAALVVGLATAWAGPLEVAVTDAPLRPGRAATVEVASTDPDSVPRLSAQGGALRSLGEVRPGVWGWTLVPELGEVLLTASTASFRTERRVPSALPQAARLVAPDRVDGVAGGEPIVLRLGDPTLPPEALEVAAGEGRVAAVRAVAGGVEVVLEPEPSPFPRVVPVALRDRRTDDAPRWVEVRLRARPRIPLDVDPGVAVTLEVGGRSYGPFVADGSGHIEAVIDQYPGESVARARLVDDLGNETFTDLPLSSGTQTTLVGLVAGERLPGVRPPLVFLQAARSDGRRLDRSRAPVCQTPQTELSVWALDDGWVAAAPAVDAAAPSDLRVACRFDGAQRDLKLPVTEGVPSRLQVRLWPEDLRTDFPVSEVRVVLEDTRGDRLETDRVQVRALRGTVELESARGIVARGEYDGTDAVAAGSDTLIATWSASAGEGPLRGIDVAWSPGEAGRLVVHGRATDALGRPLPDVPVRLSAMGDPVDAVTDASGYASASLPWPDGIARVRASAGPWTAEALAPTGTSLGGPGSPDLSDAVGVTIQPGLISGISVELDPPVLRAGPGALAWVYVTLEDRSGAPVPDADVQLSASEGTLGELRARGDGRFVAEYTPEPSGRVRDVLITAESDGVRSASRLSVQPRNLRVGFGPWLGWQGNFGEVSSATLGADLDVRLRNRLVGETVMLRLGAAGYAVTTDVPGADTPLELAATVFPANVALLLREDPGAYGIWFGGGGSVAMQRLVLRSDTGVLSSGTRWLVGPVALVGVGRRVLSGEGFVEARASWLSGRTGQVGYSGNIGGLGVGVGWRVVY